MTNKEIDLVFQYVALAGAMIEKLDDLKRYPIFNKKLRTNLSEAQKLLEPIFRIFHDKSLSKSEDDLIKMQTEFLEYQTHLDNAIKELYKVSRQKAHILPSLIEHLNLGQIQIVNE